MEEDGGSGMRQASSDDGGAVEPWVEYDEDGAAAGPVTGLAGRERKLRVALLVCALPAPHHGWLSLPVPGRLVDDQRCASMLVVHFLCFHLPTSCVHVGAADGSTRQTVAAGSSSFNCWFHLGLMHFRAQMYSKAKDAFQRSLEALKLLALRNPAKAGEARFAALEARSLSLVAQCSIYELTAPGAVPSESQNPQIIQEKFINATLIDNKQADIWNNIGLLHMSLDKFDGARQILQPILNNFPQYNDAMCNLGLTNLCNDDVADASKNLQTVILRDANHLEALNNYGVLLLRHQSYSNAAIFFEKSVELDPSSYSWSNLACAYSGAGRLADAARAFGHARNLDESNVHATYNLAHHVSAMVLTESDPAARAQKLEQAENLYSTVLGHNKNHAHAWTGLASVFHSLTKMSEDDVKAREYKEYALEAFAHAVQSDPCDPVVWTQVGVHSMSEGDHVRAKVCFATALKYSQNILATWSNLALALQLAELPDEALAVYNKALTTFHSSHELTNNLGNLHRQMGNLDQAMAAYRSCLQMKNDYALGYNNISLVHILREVCSVCGCECVHARKS